MKERIIVLAFYLIPLSAAAQPRLVVEPESLRLGTYPPDEYYTGNTFTVANEGNEELLVNGISGELDWFSFEPAEFAVAPDTVIRITVVLRETELEVGEEYDFNILIVSNDPDREEYILPGRLRILRPPVLVLNPDRIESEVYIPGSDTAVVTIANTGEAPLRFTTRVEEVWGRRDAGERSLRSTDGRAGPRRDPAGDLVAEFRLFEDEDESIMPLAWDRENQWMAVHTTRHGGIAVTHDANYENYEVVRERFIDGWIATWLDGIYYVSAAFGSIVLNLYNANGQNIGSRQYPFAIYGLAADNEEELLFVQETQNNFGIHVYSSPYSYRNEIGLIDNWLQFANGPVYDMEWVPEHADGQLWVRGRQDGRAYQIHVDTERWQADRAVQNFWVGGMDWPGEGMVHDGNHFWVGSADGLIRIFDDGIMENPWIFIEPGEGEVVQNGEMELQVIMDADEAGVREAIVHILSNDPDAPDMEIPVTLSALDSPSSDFILYPSSFILYPAFPNPFNSSTTIRFALPKPGTVRLEVYDVVGRRVKDLIPGSWMTAGENSLLFDGAGLSSGVYILRLQAGDVKLERAVSLVK